ncbi:MAG: hypothetical protein ACRD1I_00615, partial [Terriglobia bacterium]
PVDPTAFVTQLAQFTQLDEVSQIYSLLQSYVQGAGSTPGTSSPSSGSGSPSGSQGTPGSSSGSGNPPSGA